MGLEFLLLPAIAGYWLQTELYVLKYRIENETGQGLVFRSALTGVILMTISHVIIFAIEVCKVCQWPEGWWLVDELIGDYPPSIILCFVLAMLFLGIGNLCFDEVKSARRAAKRNGNLIAHLIARSNEAGESLLRVALRDGRIYVGLITDCGFRSRAEFNFAIVPLASGFEDKDTQKFTIVKFHSKKIWTYFVRKSKKISSGKWSENMQIILSSSDVLDVRVFDPTVPSL